MANPCHHLENTKIGGSLSSNVLNGLMTFDRPRDSWNSGLGWRKWRDVRGTEERSGREEYQGPLLQQSRNHQRLLRVLYLFQTHVTSFFTIRPIYFVMLRFLLFERFDKKENICSILFSQRICQNIKAVISPDSASLHWNLISFKSSVWRLRSPVGLRSSWDYSTTKSYCLQLFQWLIWEGFKIISSED